MSNPDYLGLLGKKIVVFGIANRKSVAYHITKQLEEAGAACIAVVQNDTIRERVAKLLPEIDIFTCDVEDETQIDAVARQIGERHERIDGLVHSIAYADYSEGIRPFHETPKKAFLQAIDISCYSLIRISKAFAPLFSDDASVVTISISTTTMASESYGYMAPIKAALESSVVFLAKSFSRFSKVRFNAVCPGLLKTSASAGIPGYLDAYLFAEQVIPRKEAVKTDEAAAAAVFLLSPRASGINAQKIVVDAGMAINYFDQDIVKRVVND